MRAWLHSFFQPKAANGPRLEIRIHRRDTIVYQNLLTSTHTFSIGRSLWNPVAIDTPSLPFDRFPLVQFRAGKAFVQFTPQMHGSLMVNGQMLTLGELCEAGQAELTPMGHRVALPQEARLNLFVDGLLIRLSWVEPSFSSWDDNMPLTPSSPSLPMAA